MNTFEKKYIKERKRLLRELGQLIYNRVNLNKEIKKTQKEMDNLDKALLNK